MLEKGDVIIVARNKNQEKENLDNLVGSEEKFEVVEKPLYYLYGKETRIIVRLKLR